MGRAIGIDLGTSFTCAAVFKNGQVEIIANDRGNHTTPSVVAFTETERLFGEDAIQQISWNSSNTLLNVKRLIGRQFNDRTVQEDKQNLPYEIVNDQGRIKIAVQFMDQMKQFAPEEISAMVLWKMKILATEHLGEEVKDAVITVPAYFNDAQKTATRNAGEIAGLKVMRIINEPTAAALAYGFDNRLDTTTNVLVFDLGGGTFDVSVLEITENVIEVKATSGNNHLGGEDFNNVIVKHFMKEFHQKYGKDIRSDARAVRRLTATCENAKRTLSTEIEAVVQLDSLVDDTDFYTSLTRKKFEELCNDLFNFTLESVEDALSSSQKDRSDIDEIILVGGSTKIPKIQSLLQAFFPGKKLNMSINPDESVAYGAALNAAVLSKETSNKLKDLLLLDVTPLSLGVKDYSGKLSVVIPRNSLLPKKAKTICKTADHKQTAADIHIYEGERYLAIENNLLGSFKLMGIPPAKRGVEDIELIFDINADGILKTSATVVSTGNTNEITIKRNDRKNLSDEEIQNMVKDAQRMQEEDAREIRRIQARNDLKNYCEDIKVYLNNKEWSSNISNLSIICETNLEWIRDHQDGSEDEFTSNKKIVADMFDKIDTESSIKLKNQGSASRNKPPVIQASTTDENIKNGDILMKNKRKTKEDVQNATAFYGIASLIAGKKKKGDKLVIGYQKLGISFIAQAEFEEDQSYLKLHFTQMAAIYLGRSLMEDTFIPVKNETLITETTDFIRSLKTDFFEKIVPYLADEKKWGAIDSFVSSLGVTRYISHYDWKMVVAESRINQVELLLELALDHMRKKSYTAAVGVLRNMAKALTEANEVCPEDSVMKERCGTLSLDYSSQVRVAKANLCYEEADELITYHNDNTSSEKNVSIIWSALDKIKEAQSLVKDYDVEMLCKAVVKEGILFMKYIKNKRRAKKSFEKMITIVSETQLFNSAETEWYIEASRCLQSIEDELNKEEPDKNHYKEELQQDLAEINDAHKKAKTEKEFIDCLFSKLPPKHRANYADEKPKCGAGDEKVALRKLLVFYHPDKISKTQFGRKYYYICEEITKILTERYEKYQ